MTKHHPERMPSGLGHGRDYLPAAGRDAFLPGYDLLTRLAGMPKVYERLIAEAQLQDGHRVLEVGCGTGNLTVRVANAGRRVEVVGLDPDPKALARAQRKAAGLTGIRFEHGFGEEMPYADGSFDRVLSSMMFHHLDEQAKVAVAGEVLRVLRPGSSLHLVDIGGEMTYSDGFAARRHMRGHHISGNLGDSIPRLLQANGFDCTVVTSERHRLLGRLTYYRAVRTT